MQNNILLQANDIVYSRSEEKTRQYGDFIESMTRMSRIATEMCNKEITVEDCYKIMVALKLSREAYSHKEDNLLDIVAYLASLNEYQKTKQ
jgi:hypothetical protein